MQPARKASVTIALIVFVALLGLFPWSWSIGAQNGDTRGNGFSTTSIDGITVCVCFETKLDEKSATNISCYSFVDKNSTAVVGALLLPNQTSVRLQTSGLHGTNYSLKVDGVLGITGNNISGVATGTILNLHSQDIGSVRSPSSLFSPSPETIEVQPTGNDIWFGSDSFQFTHQEKTGDFDVRVQVEQFIASNIFAKAVLMARENAGSGSRHVSVAVYPTKRNWTAFHREKTGEASSLLPGDWRLNWPETVEFPNVWMRLRRTGNAFTTFGSADGINWTQIGMPYVPEIPFPKTILVGLGSASRETPEALVRFRHFGDYAVERATITITKQPGDLSVTENRTSALSVIANVVGAAPEELKYQWTQNGRQIPGATGSSIALGPINHSDKPNRYKVQVCLPGQVSVFSDEAEVFCNKDIEPPQLIATTSLDGKTVAITFDELLHSNTVKRVQNFSIPGATKIQRVQLTDSGNTVVLHLSEPLKEAKLTFKGIEDLAGNASSSVTSSINVLGWTVTDIGKLAERGIAFARRADSIVVRGGGRLIWQEADDFTFVHRPVTGDFDVRVQLARLDSLHSSTRAGLMIREDLTPGSRNFFVGTYPMKGSKKWVASCRYERNGSSSLAPGDSYTTRSGTFAFPNVWVRLKRFGDTLTAFHSANGLDWTQLGDQLVLTTPYSNTIHLGLATVAAVDAPGVATVAEFRSFGAVSHAETAGDRPAK